MLFVFTSCKKEVKTNDTTISNKRDTIEMPLRMEISKIDYTLNKEQCGKSFEVFFEEFSKDSIFQKSRVQYPLRFVYAEGLEDTKWKTDYINKASEFYYIDFTEDKSAMNKEYDKYTVEIEKIDGNNIYYKNLGYDNGIRMIFKFKKVDDCWLLVEILDEST